MKTTILLITSLMLLTNSFPLRAQSDSAIVSWEAVDSNGEKILFPNQDQDLAIVVFWATWCPYCKQLMPHLQSILDEYTDQTRIKVYALSIRDDGDPKAYINDNGYTFTLVTEADSIAKQYGVKGTPGLFLIDKKGMVLFDLNDVFRQQKQLSKELSNWEKAHRRAPFWGAKIRQAIDLFDSGQ